MRITMKDDDKKYKIAVAIVAVLTLVVIVIGIIIGNSNDDKVAEVTPEPKPMPTVVVKETVKEVEVRREVSVQLISEELKDMGELNTAEYCFTMVEEYSKIKPVFKVFDATASFMYSYDGSISAGIECDKIKVEKDEENKSVTITLPKSKITHVDIDKDSFQAYSEKEQLWNKLTIEDYNDSLKEFETKAKAKAMDKGVLNRADENAKKTILSFVTSLLDDSEYKIVVRVQGEK